MHRFIQCIIRNHTDAVITAAAHAKCATWVLRRLSVYPMSSCVFMSNFHIYQSMFFTRLLQNGFVPSSLYIFRKYITSVDHYLNFCAPFLAKHTLIVLRQCLVERVKVQRKKYWSVFSVAARIRPKRLFRPETNLQRFSLMEKLN